jgi:CHASE2 domain-containing sensor protein
VSGSGVSGSLRPTDRGGSVIGALLAAGYLVLAVAAGGRAGVQMGTRLGQAPVPYLLSGAAAAVYGVICWALRDPRRRGLAVRACLVELIGVLGVGTWSLLSPGAFPDQTVWSGYGVGYGLAPLALPLLALAWLRRPP